MSCALRNTGAPGVNGYGVMVTIFPPAGVAFDGNTVFEFTVAQILTGSNYGFGAPVPFGGP